jgi:hypothetical protein
MWTQTKLVWSAHRHSSSVKTFKSVMLLRHEGWNWADTPAAASIWLLDGGLPCTSVELEKLAAIQANNGSKVALLSRQFMTLPGLECMFFKTPLNSSTLESWNSWILRHTAQDVAASSGRSQFAGKGLHLVGWPNLSRYTDKRTLGNSLSLSIACTEMLRGWCSYESIADQIGSTAFLNKMLDDALAEGLLEVTKSVPGLARNPVAPTWTRSAVREATEDRIESGSFGFLKRLFAKFS